MGARRGRPSKAGRERSLKESGDRIAEHFRSYPLDQPLDLDFDRYYQRILGGDPSALLDYCNRHKIFDRAFYEAIGRLVPLQYIDAARVIISEIGRRGQHLGDASRGLDLIPRPYRSVYQYWYRKLLPVLRTSRKFIHEKYKTDPFLIRQDVWKAYVGRFYAKCSADCSHDIEELMTFEPPMISNGYLDLIGGHEWMERICAGVRSDESRDPSDTDRRILSLLVEHLYLHRLVPKPVFFELAETTKRKREDAQADYDKRYRHPPLPFDSSPHCAKVRLWDGRHLRESC